MTEQDRSNLVELQRIDLKILAAQQRIREFDPLLDEVEQPALVLESDAEKTRARLKEINLEERQLELSVAEKRERQKKLDERSGSVRNLREEAAVSAELEMVKRALQNDEQEALSLLDQIRRMEGRLEELDEAITEARAFVGPRLEELRSGRDTAEKELDAMEQDRENFVDAMDAMELRLYEGIRRGGRVTAVAALTEDGACSHCFGIVPPQLQNEITHGKALIRCEGCGVILTVTEHGDDLAEVMAAEEPAEEEAAEEPAEEEAAEEPAEEEAAEEPAEEEAAEEQQAAEEPAEEEAAEEPAEEEAAEEPAEESCCIPRSLWRNSR